MIVGFSKYGKGPASSAFDYLMNTKDEERPPKIVRGCPRLTGKLIDSLTLKHKYTSGVLSFAPGETISPEMEQAIMDEFEAHAFAGLDHDQYSICWIRHSHAGHHELHFVTARCELSTGKSLNIAPPEKKELNGRRPYFDDWRSMINARYGLADPDDPERAQDLKIPNFEAKIIAMLKRGSELNHLQKWVIEKAELRDAFHEFMLLRVREGFVNNREDVLKVAAELGLEISRAGKEYITIKHGDLKIKMKGMIYEQEFDRTAALETASRAGTPGESDERPQRDFTKADPAAAESYRQRVTESAAKRAEYNRKRYKQKHAEVALANDEKSHAVASNDVIIDLRSFIHHHLGNIAIPSEHDYRTKADDTATNSAWRSSGDSAMSAATMREDRRGSTEIQRWLQGDKGVLDERPADSFRESFIGTIRTITQTAIKQIDRVGSKFEEITHRIKQLFGSSEERERPAFIACKSLERASAELNRAIEALNNLTYPRN